MPENRIVTAFWEAVAEAAWLASRLDALGKNHEYHNASWFAHRWLTAERSRPWTDWGSEEQITEARELLTFIARTAKGTSDD